jgi:hypothetical protein
MDPSVFNLTPESAMPKLILFDDGIFCWKVSYCDTSLPVYAGAVVATITVSVAWDEAAVLQ